MHRYDNELNDPYHTDPLPVRCRMCNRFAPNGDVCEECMDWTECLQPSGLDFGRMAVVLFIVGMGCVAAWCIADVVLRIARG